MQKFKTFVTKHWIILYLIGGCITCLALVMLPNLSNLAIQSITPVSELTQNTNKITKNWGNHLNNATPVSITYSVPTEFSPSQKLRLENKERFFIEHKANLKLYKISSMHTNPHAEHNFNGRNWRKLIIWIPKSLVNQPLYQAQTRHFCALSGIKTQWNNPVNERYQKFVSQWYQQKIICIWILLISFICLLTLTSLTKACLLSLANFELNIVTLSLSAKLIKPFFFYTPLIVCLVCSLLTIIFVLFTNQPKWLAKLRNPMRDWHPLITILLIISLIFPLLTNCKISLQQPQPHQTITVYLNSKKSLLKSKTLIDLDHLTKVIKSLPNVSQVASLTQPAGHEINKYQLDNQLDEIKQNLVTNQKRTHKLVHEFKKSINNKNIPTDLQVQTEQLKQLQTKTEMDEGLTKLVKEQSDTNTDITKHFKQQTAALSNTQTQLTEINADDELHLLSQMQKQTQHQFNLNKTDALDSDFSQTCFNFNNESQTATRIDITLRNGKLGQLPRLIKHQLSDTDFSNNIGISGTPVSEATQQQNFKHQLPILLLLLSLLLLISNSLRFKSIGFGIITIILASISAVASLGMLNYLTNYQFTPTTGFLFLILIFILTILPSSKNTILFYLFLLIPFFLVSQFHALGIFMLTFSMIYHCSLPVLLKIKQQKRLLFRSLITLIS